MKNSRTIFQEVVESIDLPESPEEIRSIVYFLLTSIFDITKTDILAGKMVPFSDAVMESLEKAVKRINRGEPVQYVQGEAYFFGRKFQVNASVLIPRPETEGLVRAVLSYVDGLSPNQKKQDPFVVLDVGTGSGCIPVTLFYELPNVRLYATDVSNAALSVAVNNAEVHKANVTFIEHNIMTEQLPVQGLDAIVSNPPYVTESEKNQMQANVLDYEPHDALFVPDDDPLLFYRAIVQQSHESLKVNGLLAMEINPRYAEQVLQLVVDGGFGHAGVVQDISGKDRVVSGIKTT